jgi:hypothetical protein
MSPRLPHGKLRPSQPTTVLCCYLDAAFDPALLLEQLVCLRRQLGGCISFGEPANHSNCGIDPEVGTDIRPEMFKRQLQITHATADLDTEMQDNTKPTLSCLYTFSVNPSRHNRGTCRACDTDRHRIGHVNPSDPEVGSTMQSASAGMRKHA